jgi:lipopolysaccharide export system protein LptA
MQKKIFIITLLLICLLTSLTAAAPANPVITADKTYYDVNTGLYVLKGNVYIEARGRVITAGMARVSLTSLEVWGSGGVTVTQGDIYFSGDSVYVYGMQDRAVIDGGITFKRTGLTISANKAEFNWKSKVGVFTGNVKITQGDLSWTTDTLSYNVDTNTIVQ